MEVKIVKKDGCPYCDKAMELLANYEIVPETEVINDAVARNAFYDSLGLEGANRTVPQIYINGTLVGGYKALENLANAGLLD